jgi:hypothetical protein
MNFFTHKKIKQILGKAFFALVLMVVLGGVVNPQIVLGAPCTQVQINAGWTNQVAGIGAPPTCSPPAQAGQSNTPINDVLGTIASVASDFLVGPLFKFIGYVLQVISSRILGLSGYLFDTVIKFTILQMSENLQGEKGIGTSIELTWGTLRDIANMFFILVLLFTAFKAMFQLSAGNVGRSILNIIIVALLINFSLFFTKVVIDASNVVAIGFYNSIVSSRSAAPATEGTQEVTQSSISSGYMRLLGLQSWYDPSLLTAKNMGTAEILVTGLMSSLFMLVAAVVMFVASIMLITRWVLLALLMILSPVAFIAIIVPGMKGNFDKWMHAVIDQSFFAPLYFAMTWVSFKVAIGYQQAAGGVLSAQKWSSVGFGTPDQGTMTLILNYFLVIGFSIAALIFAKKMASKTDGFTAITGSIGAGAVGGAAFMGRQTIGRGGRLISDNFRDTLSKTAVGRAGLWAANKSASGSFDVRAIDTLKKVPGLGKEIDILGKAGGKGGFSSAVEEKAKKKAAYAKAVYGQSESEKEELEKMKKDEEVNIKNERVTKERSAKEDAKVAEDKRRAHMETRTGEFSERIRSLNLEKKDFEAQLKAAKDAGDTEKAKEINKELASVATQIANEREAKKEKEKEVEETDDTYKNLKELADTKKEAAKEAKARLKKKEFDKEEYTKKTQDFMDAPEKRQKDFAERVRKGSPVSTIGGAGTGAALGGTIGTLGGPIGTVIGASIGTSIGAILGKKIGESLPDEMNWQGNIAAARKIKADAGGKSKKEKLADLAKEVTNEETPPATPPETPAATT